MRFNMQFKISVIFQIFKHMEHIDEAQKNI